MPTSFTWKSKLCRSTLGALLITSLGACQQITMKPGGELEGGLPTEQINADAPASAITQQPTPAPEYRHVISFVTDHFALRQALKDAFSENPNFSVTHQDDFSQLRLIVQAKPVTEHSLQNAPRMFGILNKQEYQPSLALQYQLLTADGTVLSEGDTVAVGNPGETFTLNEREIYADPQMIADAVNQLTRMVNTNAVKLDWRARVIGQPNVDHVAIDAGAPAGINLGDKFKTETYPRGFLEVVSFLDSTGGHKNRAVLRLVKGELPSTGRNLIPISRKALP